MSAIPIFVFNSGQTWTALEALKSHRTELKVNSFPLTIEISTEIKNTKSAIVMFLVRDRSDFSQIETFLAINKNITKNRSYKLVSLNFSAEKDLDQSLSKLGINDYLSHDVSAKVLATKISFWLKAMGGEDRNGASQEAQKKGPGDLVITPSAINCEEDIWLLTEQKPKKILGKWLLTLLGPGPYAARWTEERKNLWRFEINEDTREIFVPQGNWYFRGEHEPEFNWKTNRWSFSGEEYELFFESQTSRQSRASATKALLKVPKNSLFAETKRDMILQTFDNELKHQERPPESAENESAHFEKESSHLSGPLKGKVKEASDHIPTQMDGESKTEKYKNLSGKLGKKDLSQKKKDDVFDDESEVFEEVFDDRSSYVEAPLENLRGRSKTDHLHQGPLKNKPRGEVFDDTSDAPEEMILEGPVQKKREDLFDDAVFIEEELPEVQVARAAPPRTGEFFDDQTPVSLAEEDVVKDPSQNAPLVEKERPEEEAGIDSITVNAFVEVIILQNGKTVHATLDDKIDDVIFFMTDEPVLETDQDAEVEISFHMLRKPFRLQLSGTMMAVSFGSGSYFYAFKISNSQKFEMISKLFEIRQKMVTKFLTLAYGI